MALKDGFPSASGVADANDIRLGLAGLVVRDTSGNPRTGIFPRHGNALVTATATMNSAVAAFEACLSRSGQGAIFLANDGTVNVLHEAAPVSNKRYDIIYVKQNDAVAPNADANSLPVFGILKGTPAPSPALPTWATAKAALDAAPGVLPGAEPLAAVEIPSTATSMQSAGVVYTQLYQYTATSGGVVRFRTKAELDLWTNAAPDQRAQVTGEGIEYVRHGTAWLKGALTQLQLDTTNSVVGMIQQVGFGKIVGNGTAEIRESVTFPTPFAGVPSVHVTSMGYRGPAGAPFNLVGLSDGSPPEGGAHSPSATGFNAVLRLGGSTLSPGLDWYYTWHAIGVPA